MKQYATYPLRLESEAIPLNLADRNAVTVSLHSGLWYFK